MLLDVVPASVALLFSLESLVHPFGRDQGLYFYIGREWFLRGALPYRDTFDVKTPGIYLLYGLSALCFGDRMWGIRLFDVLGLIALALLCARLSAPREERVPAGTRGIAMLAAAVTYYGHFDFWNTAQCELWCALFSLASVLVAAHGNRTIRNAFLSGVLGGIAVLFKPPALVVCGVAALALVLRCWESEERTTRERLLEGAKFVASYTAGGAFPIALMLAYFAAKGGLGALYDVLVVNNRHYVLRGRWVHSYRDAWNLTRHAWNRFDPWVTLLLWSVGAMTLLATQRGAMREVFRRALPLLLLLCGLVAVAGQMKFVWYHWGLLVVPSTLAFALLHNDVRAWFVARSRRGAWATLWGCVAIAWCFYANQPEFDRWWMVTSGTVMHLRGTLGHRDYVRLFSYGPPMPFSFENTEELGLWLRAHANPTDRVSVRGFEPQIYTVSGLRGHGRFFWTTFLVRPEWAYRMNEWVAEDAEVFRRNPPRWVLAIGWVHTGVDCAEYFYERGYERVAEMHGYVLLEWRGRRP